MSAEISLKDLKALLDDNDLDLSMRQLTTVPAKALSKIPRATHLDFSNNLIATLPNEFCTLTHITKLDLSNNHIVHLPDEFGKLINLTHLDLYKNEIEELPLSFADLASLRWLDLKGNPLELELSKAAGDCLDEKGCKQAAVNVVRLMRDRIAKQQRILSDQQKTATKQSGDNDTANALPTMQKEKTKKKKNKHRDSANEHATEPVAEIIQQNGPQIIPEKTQQQNDKTERIEKRNSSSVMRFLWRIFAVLLVLSLIVSGLSVVIVVSNCVGNSRYWFPASKPFCNDLRIVMEKHSLPPSVSGNFFLAIASLLKSWAEVAGDFWKELQRSDFIAFVNDYFHSLYMNLVSVTLLVQGYLIHNYEDFSSFYYAYLADTINDMARNIWLLLRIFGLMLADALIFIADKGLLFISSLVETLFTYAHRGDQLAEVLRKWWNNMK